MLFLSTIDGSAYSPEGSGGGGRDAVVPTDPPDVWDPVSLDRVLSIEEGSL